MANWGKRTQQLQQGGTWVWRPKSQITTNTQLPQHDHHQQQPNVHLYETEQHVQKRDTSNNWRPNSHYKNTSLYQYGNYNHTNNRTQLKSVPLWEKKFCASMGVAWRKLETAKRDMIGFPRIVKWDSSAAQEAFEDGKRRYWAKMKGLPCDDVPLPDPDAWIDDVDWDCAVDDELVMEAEWEREKRVNYDDGILDGWEENVRTGWMAPSEFEEQVRELRKHYVDRFSYPVYDYSMNR